MGYLHRGLHYVVFLFYAKWVWWPVVSGCGGFLLGLWWPMEDACGGDWIVVGGEATIGQGDIASGKGWVTGVLGFSCRFAVLGVVISVSYEDVLIEIIIIIIVDILEG